MLKLCRQAKSSEMALIEEPESGTASTGIPLKVPGASNHVPPTISFSASFLVVVRLLVLVSSPFEFGYPIALREWYSGGLGCLYSSRFPGQRDLASPPYRSHGSNAKAYV